MLDTIALVGAVLGSPTRLRLFLYVTEHQDATVGAVARALGCTPANVVRHCYRLEEVGLIERLRHGRETWLRARVDRFRPIRDAALLCSPTSRPAPLGSSAVGATTAT